MATVSIPLHSRKYPGLFAIIDEEDYERVSQYRWHPRKSGRTFYVETNAPQPDGSYRILKLHRLITDAQPGVLVDHQDRDGLHNWRANLRLCNHSQNMHNYAPGETNTTGYRGVSPHTPNRWRASIRSDGKTHFLGLYDSPEVAARAYDAAAREMWGEFAWLNFPDDHRPTPDSRGQIRRDNQSGFRGVRHHPRAANKKWQAVIGYQKGRIALGYYCTPEEAAQAYDAKARELYGDAAQLNFPKCR